MSRYDWIDQFVLEAALDPRRFVRTIALARADELLATAAALGLVENPAVQVLGYAALARRSHARRVEFLARAAGRAESLIDVVPRVGALTALFDVLPKPEATYFFNGIAEMLADLEPDLQERYRHLLFTRAEHAGIELASVPNFEPPPPLAITRGEMAYDLERAVRRALRPLDISLSKIRPIDRRHERSPSVRLVELAESLGIHRDPVPLVHTGVSVPFAVANTAPSVMSSDTAAPPDRIVSTGFADTSGEAGEIAPEPGSLHYFFIHIGDRVDGAAESDFPLSADLAAGSVIDVVMFTNDDGLTIEGPRSGRFRIAESGEVLVAEPAAVLDVNEEYRTKRMFFSFRSPEAAGLCSMRCSFYCRGILIQSRIISVPVGSKSNATVRADYVLSRTLSPRTMAAYEPAKLSVMLNKNADGTHSFRFYGDDGNFAHSSTFGELELKDHIGRARQGLRFAAWGTTKEWTPADRYRFTTARTIDSVMPDLLQLARRGRVLWDAVVDKLSGGPDATDQLRDMMRHSGLVQLALKEGPNLVLPMSLFYDHELDISRTDDQMRLCPAFVRSLGRELVDEPCLKGDCPNRDSDDVVCPGGFWGFRHAIGLPVSIGAEQSSPPEIRPFIIDGDPSLIVAVSTDQSMSRVTSHLATLELRTGSPQQVLTTRNGTLAAMRAARAPIVYFYCHGGINDIEGPFLEVGPPGGARIARNNLRKIRWKAPRPIVFMNGCHTTSVSPEDALELVSGFVQVAGASGVIGTEVTIFESLAAPFAEAFFQEFVANGLPAGEAIRRARLRLLKDSLNPLGLVYITFALSSLLLRPGNKGPLEVAGLVKPNP